MKISLLNATAVKTQLSRLIKESTRFYWAVAWGSDGPMADELLHHHRKMKKILIGTDFCQTDPKLLDRLKPHSSARIAIGLDGGTFHPKMYLFESENSAAVVIGSANFTRGGLGNNHEAAVLLEGQLSDTPIGECKIMIEQLWKQGSAITDAYLTAYRLQHEATRDARTRLSTRIRIRTARAGSVHPNLLTQTWKQYLANVVNSDRHGLELRLDILHRAQKMFARETSFAKLARIERKAIAGFIGSKEIVGTELEPDHWGYFGSMKGAGSFKSIVNNNSERLAKALDHIPTHGGVTRDDYRLYIRDFQEAFRGAARGGGVATASRLLAMKRPDYFVCVDSKNRDRLGKDLDFSANTLNYESYWYEVVEPVTQSVWWREPRPQGKNGLIWDGRAAMLDCIYYDYD